jgi:hypothetical protein
VLDSLRRAGHQRPAHPGTLPVVAHVQVVDEAAPPLVVVGHDVDEADQLGTGLRQQRPASAGSRQP